MPFAANPVTITVSVDYTPSTLGLPPAYRGITLNVATAAVDGTRLDYDKVFFSQAANESAVGRAAQFASDNERARDFVESVKEAVTPNVTLEYDSTDRQYPVDAGIVDFLPPNYA